MNESKLSELLTQVSEGKLPPDQALERLTGAGIWHELVRDYDTLRDNPQVRHLGAFVDTQTQGGSPMTLLARDRSSPPAALISWALSHSA